MTTTPDEHAYGCRECGWTTCRQTVVPDAYFGKPCPFCRAGTIERDPPRPAHLIERDAARKKGGK